jgi:hypothetical protein
MPNYDPAVKATEADDSIRRREGDTDSDRSLSLTDALAHNHLAILGLSPPAMHHQQTYTPLAIPFFPRALQSDSDDTMIFAEVQQPSVPTRRSAHHSSFVSRVDRRRMLLVATNEEEHQGAEDVVTDDIVIVDWRRNMLGVLHDVSRILDEDEDEDWTE